MEKYLPKNQCFGSVSFWCGSGSVDPKHCLKWLVTLLKCSSTLYMSLSISSQGIVIRFWGCSTSSLDTIICLGPNLFRSSPSILESAGIPTLHLKYVGEFPSKLSRWTCWATLLGGSRCEIPSFFPVSTTSGHILSFHCVSKSSCTAFISWTEQKLYNIQVCEPSFAWTQNFPF